MRRAIRRKLIDSIPSIAGHVYEPYNASETTPKPYLVVKQAGEYLTNTRMGFDLVFQVWAYTDRTSQVEVDTLLAEVVNALVGTDLTTESGLVFQLRYIGSISDFYDDNLQALTRRASFVTEIVRGG